MRKLHRVGRYLLVCVEYLTPAGREDVQLRVSVVHLQHDNDNLQLAAARVRLRQPSVSSGIAIWTTGSHMAVWLEFSSHPLVRD